MASRKWVLFIMVCAAVAAQARAWSASCDNPKYRACQMQLRCPSKCPQICKVNCRRCKPFCPPSSAASLSAACDKPGAVCHDPRFIGGDGSMFYFHGKKDRDFCLVSDPDLHINGHFMGKSETHGLKHDMTWLQSIGVRFGSHQIYLGANKVARWDSAMDQLMLLVDGQSVVLPPRKGAEWENPLSRVKITRVQNVNAVILQVADIFSLTAWVVPITAEESRVHGYEITEDDCFAHLHLHFQFFDLSPNVTGILGQTYSAVFKSSVKVGAVMEGEDMFAVSHLFATDCKVARFGEEMESRLGAFRKFPTVSCASDNAAGRGIVCRR